MGDVLVDTDVVVDHLRGARALPIAHRLLCSAVTRSELRSGRDGESSRVSRLIDAIPALPVDEEVADRAGRIRRLCGLRLPDALVAATALTHDLPLLSRHRRHFLPIPGLRLVAEDEGSLD